MWMIRLFPIVLMLCAGVWVFHFFACPKHNTQRRQNHAEDPPPPPPATTPPIECPSPPPVPEIQATTGTVWRMAKIRNHTRRDYAFSPQPFGPDAYPTGAKWAVVTTIFQPTRTIQLLSQMQGWCTVIVADAKSLPAESYLAQLGTPSCVVYLSLPAQAELGYSILEHIPQNSFGRKNIGYLFAMQHGAQVIYDTDDDNEVTDQGLLNLWTLGNDVEAHFDWVTVGSNPYPAFGAARVWPRGLPLDQIKNASSSRQYPTVHRQEEGEVCVVQSLANEEPDVDAIYRLTHFEYPLTFSSPPGMACRIEPSWMAPFNAQATLFFKDAFALMLLPVTVHGRVSDIWRSYLAQSVMGCALAFSRPWVSQIRNSHSHLADFQAELPLYTQAASFVAHLGQRRFPSLSDALVDAYEHGVVELPDVALAMAWQSDLGRMPASGATPFRHLLIAMGRGVHLRQWKDRILSNPNLQHVDLLLGVFDEPVESLGCDAVQARVACLSSQGTTWTTGRNALARAAYRMERQTPYTYWTFADADIALACLTDAPQPDLQFGEHCFDAYDRFLQQTMAPAATLIQMGQFDAVKDVYMSGIEAFDGCFNSFHREAVHVLLPYRPDQDAVTWWSSQAIFWYKIQCLAPTYASAPLNIFYANPEHNPYPHNPRDKQAERQIGMESLGSLASVFKPAPEDYVPVYPGDQPQFAPEKVRMIDGNPDVRWKSAESFRQCSRELSRGFMEFIL
jgi:hypothetical protein